MHYIPEAISRNLVMIQPTAHITKMGEWVLLDIHDTSFRLTVKGEVMLVPDRLDFLGEKQMDMDKCGMRSKMSQFYNNRSVEFDTQMEAKIGDEVVFRYINHVECMQDGRYWYCGGKNPALFVPYDHIYMLIRDGEQIMVNGWIWVQPLEWSKEEIMNEFGAIVQKKGEKKVGIGVIRNIGNRNKGYLYEKVEVDDSLKEGDVVLFKKTAGVSAEWFAHKTLNEGKYPYYVMQDRDILAIKKSVGPLIQRLS